MCCTYLGVALLFGRQHFFGNMICAKLNKTRKRVHERLTGSFSFTMESEVIS